ncbi:MAG: ABC transporter permease [Alphaproteobacteria bacterium]|nr:ABC transporter permease [Alphaproteobacteria bacterium]
MLRFLVRRSLLVLPSLLGLLVLTFVLMRVVPSDPAAALAGETASAQQIEQIRVKYGFDRPLPEQFVIYLGQMARGDLGISVFSNRPVAQDIGYALPATIELTFCALLLAALIGIPLGTLAAVWHNSPLDHAIRMLTVAGLAVAGFWLAIMLQLLFAMDLGWLPLRGRLASTLTAPPDISGLFLVDSLLAGRFDLFGNALSHLAMPAFTLAVPGIATIARFTRAGVLETMQKDFVAYETAVGYAPARLVAIYVLRNSVVAAVTQIGLLFGALISSAVAVERIYDWPGIGSYAVTAILNLDYNAILAVTLTVGIIYAVVNILVDLAHGLIDPRVAEQM